MFKTFTAKIAIPALLAISLGSTVTLSHADTTQPCSCSKSQNPPTCGRLLNLIHLDDIWPQIMADRNLEAMGDFYDDRSILAEFPYDESKNLVGLDNISSMFENGPFSLPGKLSLTTIPIVRATCHNTGLIIKKWRMANAAGTFDGMAVKLLNYDDNKRERFIHLEAGGMVNLEHFAYFARTESTADNSAFDYLADHLLTSMAGARLIDIDNQNEPFTYGDSEATVTTIAAIPNQNQGLLIARVVNEQGEYLTFSAVENTDNGWKVVIHARSLITGVSPY